MKFGDPSDGTAAFVLTHPDPIQRQGPDIERQTIAISVGAYQPDSRLTATLCFEAQTCAAFKDDMMVAFNKP